VHGQGKSSPAPCLIQDDLTGFKGGLVPIFEAANLPDGRIPIQALDILPKQCPARSVLRGLEQSRGVQHRYVIGIDQDYFAKPAVQDCERFQRPSLVWWWDTGNHASIDDIGAQPCQEGAHARVHFCRAQVPHLNWQFAPDDLAQDAKQYPGAGKISGTTRANHDTTASKLFVRVRRCRGERGILAAVVLMVLRPHWHQ
jgi:hypothetical protein